MKYTEVALFFYVLGMASCVFADIVPESYSVTIRSSCGESTRYEAVSHEVILDNRVLSIIGKDRRRYLINLEGKSVEFSRELDAIIESRSSKHSQEIK